MTQLVEAWNAKTGQPVRNAAGGKVPKAWFQNGLAERMGLTMRPPAATAKGKPATGGDQTKEN